MSLQPCAQPLPYLPASLLSEKLFSTAEEYRPFSPFLRFANFLSITTVHSDAVLLGYWYEKWKDCIASTGRAGEPLTLKYLEASDKPISFMQFLNFDGLNEGEIEKVINWEKDEIKKKDSCAKSKMVKNETIRKK